MTHLFPYLGHFLFVWFYYKAYFAMNEVLSDVLAWWKLQRELGIPQGFFTLQRVEESWRN